MPKPNAAERTLIAHREQVRRLIPPNRDAAHLLIGKVLAAHFDARDIILGDSAIVIRETVSDPVDLARLAGAFEAVGAVKLARAIRGQ